MLRTHNSGKTNPPKGKFILQSADFIEYGTPLENLEAFVKTGIELIENKCGNKGILAILKRAGVLKRNTKLNGSTLGFVIGPIINSGSRMGKSDLGAKLLISKKLIKKWTIFNFN